ncbi:MAG TPA: FkbM family methyltransferase [Phycisphaerae bacterium]|nr:FkbM family methyltransferase [Phycisphaerae bacterium]
MLVGLAKHLGLNRSRVLYHVYHRYVSRAPHPLNMPRRDVVLETDGQKFLVGNPAESLIGQAIFYHGVWEPQATRSICPMVREGMTVVDVGAHTGYYTLLFARRVGPEGRVLAFEPEERGLAFLRRNLELNGHRNVTVLPVALSNRAARAAECQKAFYASDAGAEPPPDASGVVARVFDRLVDDLGIQRLDVVKIDVEGAELHVLEGMSESLARWAPLILLEVHPGKLENCGRSEEELAAFLARTGYQTQPVCGPSDSGVYTVLCARQAKAAATPGPCVSLAADS